MLSDEWSVSSIGSIQTSESEKLTQLYPVRVYGYPVRVRCRVVRIAYCSNCVNLFFSTVLGTVKIA